MIPVMLSISTGKVSDVGQLDALRLSKGASVVMDHGHVDFTGLHHLVQSVVWNSLFLTNRLGLSARRRRLHKALSLRNFLHLVEVTGLRRSLWLQCSTTHSKKKALTT
jgi:hypothetical protein